jgi:3-(3-hydroxy-phenyl)propionate hydroxylase
MATRIVVVGAGPVGAVLALAAARQGLEVTLLEAGTAVDESPRAATLHPSTLEMLGELGLMDEVVERGLVARYFDHWDRPSRSLIARLDHGLLADVTPYPFVVQLEQHKLQRMALARLAGYDTVDIHLGATVTGIDQDATGVVVTAERDGETERFTGDYAVGTDGGRSTVRKSQGIAFDGYTWPERFLVLTTTFDFQAEWDCSYRNYFADPEEWVNLFKVAGDDGRGRWRAVFPAPADETDEEAMSDAAVHRRLSRLSEHGDPAADVVHRKTYRVHQRVAATFRSGRVFLAGDAAHVNNPIGGLGLNCGIHDAVEFAAAVTEVDRGAEDARLDLYERRRRELNIEFVQQQTVANKKRLEETDPEQRRLRAAELAATAADPVRHRAMLMRSSLLDSVGKARQMA